jgi:hypothetical protein
LSVEDVYDDIHEKLQTQSDGLHLQRKKDKPWPLGFPFWNSRLENACRPKVRRAVALFKGDRIRFVHDADAVWVVEAVIREGSSRFGFSYLFRREGEPPLFICCLPDSRSVEMLPEGEELL